MVLMRLFSELCPYPYENSDNNDWISVERERLSQRIQLVVNKDLNSPNGKQNCCIVLAINELNRSQNPHRLSISFCIQNIEILLLAFGRVW
jgi:hypothetical protein